MPNLKPLTAAETIAITERLGAGTHTAQDLAALLVHAEVMADLRRSAMTNTVISGISGGDPFEIMLTTLSARERKEIGDGCPATALLTVRQKDTELDAAALTKLGNACLRAAKMLGKKP